MQNALSWQACRAFGKCKAWTTPISVPEEATEASLQDLEEPSLIPEASDEPSRGDPLPEKASFDPIETQVGDSIAFLAPTNFHLLLY